MFQSSFKKYLFVGPPRAATDLETNTDVAIKKIGARNFAELILAKRALREMLLLRHLNGHDSVRNFTVKNL